MPKLKGLFAYLPDITRVCAQNVREWSGRREDLHLLDNEIGNRILYPHVIPVSLEDVSLNLGIIHEVVRSHPAQYFDRGGRRILIPEVFLDGVPDLKKLSAIFLEAFHPWGQTTLLLKTRVGIKNLGTLLKINVSSEGLIDLWLHGEKHQLRTGTVVSLAMPGSRNDIKFESEVAEFLGRKSIAIEVSGGQLGLIVDASV